MKTVIESILCGIIAALAALFIEGFLSIFSFGKNNGNASFAGFLFSSMSMFIFLSALTEESLKLVLIRKKIKKISTSRKNFIKNSIIAGIGFLMIEIILLQGKYVFGKDVEYIELFKIFIFHTSTFGIIALLNSTKKQFFSSITQILLPLTLVHFAYNFSTFLSQDTQNYIQLSILSVLALLLILGFMIPNKKLAD